MDRVLLVFQKNPELGKVKTRLAASVGDQTALGIYLVLIRHTKKVLDSITGEKQIWYSSWVEHDDIWDLKSYNKFTQKGRNLGERMSNSFEFVFKDQDVKKVVIIGTDCADITADLIEEAFQSLDKYDFVIGPAKDGGYYLLGMNSFYSQVFNDIEWSTDSVFSSTVNRIKALEKSVFQLPTLSDVDQIEDWEKVKDQIFFE